MFAAEAFPFVKVGGLADVVGALPKYLRPLGAEPTVVIPAYRDIPHDRHGIKPFTEIPEFPVPMGPGSASAEIYRGVFPGTDIEVFFIGCAEYFNRGGVYDDPATHEGFPDNMERFVFFMKAGLELLRRLGIPADIVHCHDSQTGLIPALLATAYASDPGLARAGTLFTIHNLAYQGVYPKEALYWAGIDYRRFYPTSPFEFWGKVSFMKAAIEYADRISTVSRTYAREIQSSPEFGHGLEGVLRRRSADLIGIVNGIDYQEWNPDSDPWLPARFSHRDLAGKAVCKRELLTAFDLPVEERRVPLVGIVSRLTDQKGFDLIAHGIERIAAMDLKMVVLGNGQRRYHELLAAIAARYPERFAVRFGYDDRLAHWIEGGADIFLMPSRYEPCGLNQLYSLRYGTVPVVHATGGLDDTVAEWDPTTGAGTGFKFTPYTPAAFRAAVERALSTRANPAAWTRLVANGMAQDFSWDRAAAEYVRLYGELVSGRA